jgi:hypothetical protein
MLEDDLGLVDLLNQFEQPFTGIRLCVRQNTAHVNRGPPVGGPSYGENTPAPPAELRKKTL